MTLPFKDDVVNEQEYTSYNFMHSHFIGYLDPYGEPFDYSRPLGYGGHDDNAFTTYFEYYFRMPSNSLYLKQFENIDAIDMEDEQDDANDRREYFKERIISRQERTSLRRKYGIMPSLFASFETKFDLFEANLEIFFYNCYQAPTFMEGFGQNCMILNQSEFYVKYCEGNKRYQQLSGESLEAYHERHRRLFDYDYYWYKKRAMLDWYKTVIVQYMHYHLIERCAKGITTSDVHPNETFYNYLLNGYKVHQVPRMIYDSAQKRYIPYAQNSFLIPDSEIRLGEEIQAIKKMTLPSERAKYYR